jgi:hypothetical protein
MRPRQEHPPAAAATAGPAVGGFADEAEARGLRVVSQLTFPRPLNTRQTLGTGVALWDYDGDGHLDLLVVGQQGNTTTGGSTLYHNRGDGTFEDRTAGSGLGVAGPWHGCAVGDVDNDGRPDLFLTGYGDCRLFRNLGGGKFEDVTAHSGLKAPSSLSLSTSAAFADVNGDGKLDLYVARYVHFGPTDLPLCDYHGIRAACGPKSYDPERGSLYLNQGAGKFADVSQSWGLGDQQGKTLGVAFADVNGDGFPDLYLANDEVPGDLYLSDAGKRFRSYGSLSGTATAADGQPQGGMGVDWADYDGDGLPDLFVTTFLHEDYSLYHNRGQGLFEQVSAVTGLGGRTRSFVAFGTKWTDYDNDGWPDLMTVSGHIQDNAEQVDHSTQYRQQMQLFRNMRGASFQEVTDQAGEPFRRLLVGRGLAVGDVDNDGRPDAVATDLEGRPLLLMNHDASAGHWLSVRLRGRHANRMGLGARVQVKAGGRARTRECQTGGSYLSASDSRVHFGLGAADRADVEVHWPSGGTTAVKGVRAGQVVTVDER